MGQDRHGDGGNALDQTAVIEGVALLPNLRQAISNFPVGQALCATTISFHKGCPRACEAPFSRDVAYHPYQDLRPTRRSPLPVGHFVFLRLADGRSKRNPGPVQPVEVSAHSTILYHNGIARGIEKPRPR